MAIPGSRPPPNACWPRSTACCRRACGRNCAPRAWKCSISPSATPRAHLATARGAIRDRRKLAARYVDESGRETVRHLRPLGLFYWGRVWTLAAWCELRLGYRSFRIDRFAELAALPDAIPDDPAISLKDFVACIRD
ncbi:MAG: WYL domain-containing protein [Xanthomonadaceae bacterium]|nr:WYL domain-containing protein [Xanthomonadaceae bacterium]